MKRPRRISPWLLLGAASAALLLGASAASGQMIDLNGNGMSDVWEAVYIANGINPNADPDGDGFSNLQEAIAGTNPFDANSYPHIPIVAYSATNFSVTLPSAPGKLYQLQSVTTVGGTNWVMETNIEARSGVNLTMSVPAAEVMKFYRVAVSDVNSDGSGLMNDWEKYQLGLDPASPVSNGNQDAYGNALSDYRYATNLLASQNIITIAATDPTATQPDPGQKGTSTGQFTVTRGGFPLNTITVNLGPGGPGANLATAGVDYSNNLPVAVTLPAGTSVTNIILTPLADTNLATPVIVPLQIQPGINYTVGAPSNAAVLIYPSPTAAGTGLFGQYFTNSSTTYTNKNNFNPTNLFYTRFDPVIDFNWTNGTSPDLSNGLYTVRWTGQVQPQYSEPYFFDVKSDDGCRLWVNDQLLIDKWQAQGVTDQTNAIALQAGVRYDLRLEYLQAGGAAQAHLYWYSPSQSEQIIPNTCLYPTNNFGGVGSNAPAVVTSALNALGFLGQPFSFTVTGANTPLGFTANGLPPGLGFNPATGVISGVPSLAGRFQVTLTASNLLGAGASVLNLTVLNTGSLVVQEIWTNVPGTNVADIPIGSPANFTNILGTLEGITNFGDNYGERVRGYFTAPATGNYYFWIAGSDSAQLWISNDGEPVNKVLRAWVAPVNNPSASGQNGTLPRQWNLQPSQQSGWLVMNAGQKYYLEILHKAGTATNDNWSVGWLPDPTGTNTTPAGVVPGYLLSSYYPLPLSITPGTLYSATLLPEFGSTSSGSGSATMLVSADGSTASIKFAYSGLGSVTVVHLHADPYGSAVSKTLLFDIVPGQTPQQPDGSYLWPITGVGSLSMSDVQELMRQGKSYLDIHTTLDPNEPGEINGHFLPVNGSQIFVPPPAPPAWTDDSADPNAAVRFLSQATFGASANDIALVQSLGYAGWISNQFALPVTHHLPVVLSNLYPDPTDPYPSSLCFNAWWQNSITAPDQLRQRVAFALSEIFVVSENGVLVNNAEALASYYDMLLDQAFGNYPSLIRAVTLHPAMGLYLNMQGNDKGSMITGLHPNENYAREIQQLFSVGLNRLWPDGTLVLNSQNSLVPTYGQNEIMGFSSVFTGWNYYQTNQANNRLPVNWYPAYNGTNPMVLVPTHHELGTKLVLDNVMLPPAWGNQTVYSTSTNDIYCLHDLTLAMNSICNNQNVGPFICRQLIQRLVTSNPSRGYVYRVTQVFNDDGTGTRGNLSAVIQAILLDYEARSPALIPLSSYGKQREPLLRVTSLARAFPSPPGLSGTFSESGSQVITITAPTAHLMNNGDTVALAFTDTSGNPAPPSQNYSVTAIATNIFTVNAPNMSTGTYGQTNNVITVNISNHGLQPGNAAELVFTTGGAGSGLYLIATTNSTAQFTVSTPDSATRSGNCLLPKISTAGYVQTGSNVTVSCFGPHGLITNETVYVPVNNVLLASGQYQVTGIPDPVHFNLRATNSVNLTESGFNVYPLGPPPLMRSGTVGIQQSTWNMSYTDTGTTASLFQSPLRSPTVFNFFYPNYEFPGVLASAGLTTPEFQLTTDTGVAAQMNFVEGGILGNTGNTNGLSSFNGGNGAIVLNLGPWMTTNYTADAGIPTLVSNLNTVLDAGQISPDAQTNIVGYVANTNNFPYGTPPSQTQMRDRVRAVVHLITASPDYLIQK